MKKITVIAVLAALMTLGFAFEPGNGMRMKEGLGNGHPDFDRPFDTDEPSFFEELDLTTEQMEQMDKIRSEQMKENIDLNSKIKILEIDKKDALKDHNFAQAKKITDDIFKIKANLAKNRIEMKKQKWEVLTQEQQKKLDEMQLERRYHHKRFTQKLKEMKKMKRMKGM
ncbi:MAG: hypothetical protein DRZ79_00620 [Candidatus Cloacimonadota bacterium]|nr:MAG: hypothetical protein DRZ79_00620 [Candidatus Cloacimonadota bacterium]